MYIKEKYSSALAKIITNFDQVYLDTCSLMEESFPEFMDYLDGSREYWNKEDIEIIVLSSVINELKNHIDNKEKIELSIGAKRAYKIIKHAAGVFGKKLIKIEDGESEFADQEISAKAISNRTKYRILVITQDRKLATDLRKFNSLNSQFGKEIQIYRIKSDGLLEPTPSETFTHQKVVKKQAQQKTNNNKIKQENLAKPAQKAKSSDFSAIIKADIVIKANLNNSTVSKERKESGIKEQIARIESVPQPKRAEIENQLMLKLADLKALLPQQKQQPVKKPQTTYVVHSKTIFDGVVETASLLSFIIRDDSVPYNKQGHGEFDVTNNMVLNLIDKSKASKTNKSSFEIPGLKWIVEKEPNGYKVTAEKIAIKKTNDKNKAENSFKNAPKPKLDDQKSEPKAEKKTEQKKPSNKLDDVVKSENRLRANITNPNYPKEKKVLDIEAHLKLLKRIPLADRGGLKYTTQELNKVKAELLKSEGNKKESKKS